MNVPPASCGGLTRLHTGCDYTLCSDASYKYPPERVKAFFLHEKKLVVLTMVREPYMKSEDDILYMVRGESEDEFEIVHVSLPEGFAHAAINGAGEGLAPPLVRRTAIDPDTANMLLRIWSAMLSGERTVAPPNHTDIDGRTRFVFAARLGEAAKTERLDDGTCAGDIAKLGIMLIGLADALESETATRLQDIKERSRILNARL